MFTGLFRIKGTTKETYGPRTRTCRTGLMPGAEMPHLPLKQFNSRSLSASSVSSFFPQFAGLTGASLLMGLF